MSKRKFHEVGIDWQTGGQVLKLLVSSAEADAIYGPEGITLLELQEKTHTHVQLSGADMLYPGCELQQLDIFGNTGDAVVISACTVFNHIQEVCGSVRGPHDDVAPGDCRVKVIIPAKAVKVVIGPGGENIKQIRAQSGMFCHVQHDILPPGSLLDTSEQVVSLSGSFTGLEVALSFLSNVMAQVVTEPWFPAWSEQSLCGQHYPGLALFSEDGKGLGKRSKDKNGKGVGGGYQGVSIKMLISQFEATQILGKGGVVIKELATQSNCKMNISSKDLYYPGTDKLQEMRIIGNSDTDVTNAAVNALHHISAESGGIVACGETGVSPGHCRVRLIVPHLVAKAVIGVGGETIKQLRYQSEMHVHVVPDMLPPGPPTAASEQVVSLSGPLQGVPTAISFIVHEVSNYSAEPWFSTWMNNSHCGAYIPGFALTFDGKGMSKAGGKGKSFDQQPRAAPIVVAPRSKMEMLADNAAKQKANAESAIAEAEIAEMDLRRMTLAQVAAQKKAAAEKALAEAVAAEQALLEAGGDVASTSELSHLQSSWGTASSGSLADSGGGAIGSSIGSGSGAVAPVGSAVAIKVLLPPHEVACLVGDDGTQFAELQSQTGTNMRLSDSLYPGSTLHELTVQGLTADAVHSVIVQLMMIIEQSLGQMSAGESMIEPGGARIKFVLPSKAAAAIIGVGGTVSQQIRNECGVRLCVDMNTVPCYGGLFEQAILLSGGLQNLQQALPIVLEHLTKLANEKGLDGWAAHSNAGVEIPGFSLFAPKGKGKGKGKGDKFK